MHQLFQAVSRVMYIENMFCQITLHTCNGTNTNPTCLGYCYSVHSVSRKANVGGGEGGHLSLNRDAKSMV